MDTQLFISFVGARLALGQGPAASAAAAALVPMDQFGVVDAGVELSGLNEGALDMFAKLSLCRMQNKALRLRTLPRHPPAVLI